jgi:hypothetical protein
VPPPEGPDEVAQHCDALWRYMTILERLLPEPVAVAGGAAPGMHGRRAEAPVPGHQQAFLVLMAAHEGLRRLEARLLERAGLPYRGRGGSKENTSDLLDRLPKLTLTKAEREQALADLGRWIGAAKEVHGIDEAPRWRHLPRPRPGEDRPPMCPSCKTYHLLADVEAKVVACSNPGCRDKNGVPAVATMGTGPDGKPRLFFADGTEEPGVTVD